MRAHSPRARFAGHLPEVFSHRITSTRLPGVCLMFTPCRRWRRTPMSDANAGGRRQSCVSSCRKWKTGLWCGPAPPRRHRGHHRLPAETRVIATPRCAPAAQNMTAHQRFQYQRYQHLIARAGAFAATGRSTLWADSAGPATTHRGPREIRRDAVEQRRCQIGQAPFSV